MLNLSIPRNTKKSKAPQDLLQSFRDRVLRQPELLFMQFIGSEKEWKRGEEMAHKKGCSRLVSDLEFHIWRGGKSKGSVLPFRCGKVSMFYK